MTSNKKKFDSPLQATITGIVELFKKQERIGTLGPEERLDGKKVMITGSSSGLGLAVAKKIASLGGEVIMAVRSGIPEKGEEVKFASGSSAVKMLHVDLSDFSSIHNLTNSLLNEVGKIDILICNAAIVVGNARQTKDGIDEMFMVNYLSKFVLVNQMITKNCFNKSQDHHPRIIFVSSESHRNPVEFEWDSFGQFKPHSMSKTVERYGYYKLLLTTFSKELSLRLNKDDSNLFSIFTLCPGPINSNIAREAPKWVQAPMKLIFKLFFRSPEEAAEPVVYLSTAQSLEGKAFDYLYLMSRKEVDEMARDPDNGRILWDKTMNLLRKFDFLDENEIV